MIDFLTGLPLWVLGLVLNVWLIGFTLVALGILRRWVFPRVRMSSEPALYFSIGVMQAGFMLFGLIAALTAVSVWQRYEQVSGVVSEEATAIAGLYRDFSGYPQPQRGEMQEILRGYTRQIIEEAFPAHRDDRVILKGVEWMDRLQARLLAFEPSTESQKIVHAETLRAFNELVQKRRQRLDAVQSGLPGVFWLMLLPGAVGCLGMALFFHVESAALQTILLLGLAGFLAMVLFVIIALDRPFQGDLGIAPDSYILVRDHHMGKSARP